MIDYNKENADKLARDFEKLTGISLNSGSRKTSIMITRTLFYKILKDFNFMNDRMISEWFKGRGIDKNRSSIYQSLDKISIYYKSFPLFRKLYNIYFNDRAEEFIKMQEAENKRFESVKQNLGTNILKRDKDALELLIDTIPQDRRDEIREIVSLRVKSWSWKSKNECQVFLGETSMEGYCF